MTDINRLITSLKRRSAHAKEFGHDVLFVKLDDLDALVEALEKAQQRNTELENYAEAEAVGADKAAEDSVYWMKRCKALESRTVIVKLPKERSATEFMFPVPVYSVQELTASLTAQGIKWEAE
ncbi:hypothetical protein [Klebsiella aerogenes]|uniref:Ead/Ea22-like family protein n=1 Tax=Klebsiella aerogenes TaxID=548 RepID=A0AAW9LW37_KLEAE|nr:hypothetical protein [Klebsiella aerogenes]MEA8802458.1 hypothetical protein [Klebsiella aerogenes]